MVQDKNETIGKKFNPINWYIEKTKYIRGSMMFIGGFSGAVSYTGKDDFCSLELIQQTSEGAIAGFLFEYPIIVRILDLLEHEWCYHRRSFEYMICDSIIISGIALFGYGVYRQSRKEKEMIRTNDMKESDILMQSCKVLGRYVREGFIYALPSTALLTMFQIWRY